MDYEDGHPATKEYLLNHSEEEFVVPVPIYVEFLLGGVYGRDSSLPQVRQNLKWAETHPVSKETADHAARIADEVDEQGPHLSAVDALVAGMARELGAPLVTSDSDHTHPSCQQILEVEEYR